jgi:hypothetical protein
MAKRVCVVSICLQGMPLVNVSSTLVEFEVAPSECLLLGAARFPLTFSFAFLVVLSRSKWRRKREAPCDGLHEQFHLQTVAAGR